MSMESETIVGTSREPGTRRIERGPADGLPIALLEPAVHPTVSVDEAAAILGVSRGSAYAAVRAGTIPSVRVGRRLLIPTARLAALLGLSTAERLPLDVREDD